MMQGESIEIPLHMRDEVSRLFGDAIVDRVAIEPAAGVAAGRAEGSSASGSVANPARFEELEAENAQLRRELATNLEMVRESILYYCSLPKVRQTQEALLRAVEEVFHVTPERFEEARSREQSDHSDDHHDRRIDRVSLTATPSPSPCKVTDGDETDVVMED